MKKSVKFSVACMAAYYGTMEVDSNLSDEEMLNYIREHLDEVPVENLTWIEDYEPESAITEEDIISISDEYEDNEDKD